MAKKRRLRVEIAGASIASADGDSAELAPVGRKASDVFGPWVDRWTVLPAEALAHLCRVVDTGPFVGAEAWAKREGDRFVLGLDPPGEAIDPADRAVAMAAIAAATPDMQRAILEAEVRRVLGHSAGGWFPGMWEPSPLGGTAAGSTNVLLVDDVDGCDERTLPMATRVRACGGRSGAVVPFGNGHFVFWSEGVVVVPVSRRFAARDLCDHAFRVGAGGGAVADGARATAQRVRELVAAVGVAVWHCDFANDAFTLDAAWSHAWPALGPECRSFGDLLADVHPDDRGLVEEATRGIPPFNDSSLATFRVRDGAGWRWLTMRARVLSRAGDAVEVLEGTLNDVTSVKRFEEQLLQAQRFDVAGRMAAGVAHDFNNLLAIVATCAANLAGDHGETNEEICAIRDATSRGSSLTRQLLMVSGRKAFEPVICPLADVFRGNEALVRRALGARNTLHFPSAIEGVVRIDAHQIEQVFINLAVNAKDAMPDGGRLTFDVAAVSRASAESAALFALADPALWAIDYVAILVADSGSGIPPEVVSEIFEPFVSTKGPTSGTGLGLAVSRGIARAHGGDLILLSTSPKVGTTFCLLLPREVRAAGPENVKATGTSIERPGGGRQILLVDDNDALRVRLGASLRRRGWNVVLAASAAEARESWSLEPAAFVAVVTDILMPEETGDVLVARLRDLQPNLPVVYITGFVDGAPTTDDRTALLEKPFSIDALARAIEDVTE